MQKQNHRLLKTYSKTVSLPSFHGYLKTLAFVKRKGKQDNTCQASIVNFVTS
jgi:hypothetical protein